MGNFLELRYEWNSHISLSLSPKTISDCRQNTTPKVDIESEIPVLSNRIMSSRVTVMSVNGNVVFGAVLFRILRFRAKATDNNDDLNSILTNRGKNNAQQYVIDTNSRSPNVGQRCFRAYPILVFFLLFIISLPSLLAACKKENLSCADHRQVSQESTQQMIAHNGRKKCVRWR